MYSRHCKLVSNSDITQKEKSGQEDFILQVKDSPSQGKEDTPFGQRLREALGGITDSEIARKWKIRPSAVGTYTKGIKGVQRYPPMEKLIELSQKEKISLHWLILGEGPKEITGEFQLLSDVEREVIKEIAGKTAEPLEVMVRRLVLEAVTAQAAELLPDYSGLPPEKKKAISRLLALIDDDEDSENGHPEQHRNVG
jgi:hypothetical protein